MFKMFSIIGAVTGCLALGAALTLSSQKAQAGAAGCKLHKFQFAQQAEAVLGELHASGANIISFYEEKTSTPYVAFVCSR